MKASDLWQQFESFEHYNISKNLSPKTLLFYEKALRAFRKWVQATHGPDVDVDASVIRGYLASRFERGNRPRTVKTYTQTLRTFFNFLVMEEVIAETENPMRRVKSPRVARPKIEPLTPDQIRAFLDTFDKSHLAEYRDFVACSLMLDSGIRTTETLTIFLEDVDLESQSIRVNGKGNKIRQVYFGETTSALLRDYLYRCRPWLRNDSPRLFPPQWSGSRNTRLGVGQFSAMVKDRLDSIGVKRCGSSAHRLRHTFAVQYLRNGGKVFVLQSLLGHTTLKMTRHYVRLAESDLAEDHQKASPLDRLGL